MYVLYGILVVWQSITNSFQNIGLTSWTSMDFFNFWISTSAIFFKTLRVAGVFYYTKYNSRNLFYKVLRGKQILFRFLRINGFLIIKFIFMKEYSLYAIFVWFFATKKCVKLKILHILHLHNVKFRDKNNVYPNFWRIFIWILTEKQSFS